MDIINRSATIPFTTKDGSEIRELLAYRNSSIRNQSLAEATIAVGTATQEHYHPESEEIYYILSGTGQTANCARSARSTPSPSRPARTTKSGTSAPCRSSSSAAALPATKTTIR
jgi:hypothetical protein